MNCDNCQADGKHTEATITLGDGLRLCLDCWENCAADREPINAITALLIGRGVSNRRARSIAKEIIKLVDRERSNGGA